MLTVKKISKNYGKQDVLHDASFALGWKQKAGLVGSNGVGKSTLLKIIAGLEVPEAGTVEIQRDIHVGYLPQQLRVNEDETVESYIKSTVGIAEIERRVGKLEEDLENKTSQDEYVMLQNEYSRFGGYGFEHKMIAILDGFGLKDIKTREILHLSGGQKNKVVLTAILLKGVDILLLDEPTNNLDLPSLVWLEQFLKKTDATCLIVSHDRYFLDQVVDKIFEIDWFTRGLIEYSGNYSSFLIHKEKEIERQKQEYLAQQKEIARLEEAIKKKKLWGHKGAIQETSDNDKLLRGFRRDRSSKSAKGAKTLEKRIEQMEKLEKPKERTPLTISLEATDTRAKHRIVLRDAVGGYGSGFRIGPISLDMEFGERIGIIGSNGVGKSTVLKLIGKTMNPLEGEVLYGSSLKIGNLMQEHENLPRNETIYSFLRDGIDIEKEFVYYAAVRFGFSVDNIEKKIETLSPGERVRLLLAQFSLRGVNVLIFDEPTNHLDLEAMEALESVLESYEGTIVLVSHDRRFLFKASLDRVFMIDEGRKWQEVFDYEKYLASLQSRARKLLRVIRVT